MAMPPAETPADDPASVALEARLNGFDDRFAALERRLDAAQARIGGLESRAEAAPDAGALALDLAAVTARLDGAGDALANLDGRIAAVETGFAALADAAPEDAAVALDLAAIEARLAALESAPDTEPGTVPGTTLDALFPTSPPDFVKIDVEGAELRIFRGAQAILRQRQTTFFVEVHSWADPDGQKNPAEVHAFMRERGYHAVSIRGKQIFHPQFTKAVALNVKAKCRGLARRLGVY